MAFEIEIQDDEPLASAKLFNFDDYAEALTRIIIKKETKTPLVVGIFGEWGSGKTSLMKTIQNKLDSNNISLIDRTKIKTVWFNAWEQSYAQTDNSIGPSLLYCIYQELGGQKSRSKQIRMLGKGILGIVGEIGSRKYFGLGLKDILNKFEITTQSRTEFSKSFESAISNYRYNEKCAKVVIFIDDLDRCLPGKAIEILESIKLFLSTKDCVFILGMDRDIITDCIRVHYKDIISVSDEKKNPFSGEDYLEKIIQLNFQLPPIKSEDLKDFISYLIPKGFYEPYIDMMITGIGKNPRKIKRIINTIEFQRNLAEIIYGNIGEDEQSKKCFYALLVEWQILINNSDRDFINFRKQVLNNNKLLLEAHIYLTELGSFSWNEIQEKNNSDKIVNFLRQNFEINWLKTPDVVAWDHETIKISSEKNSILLKLNDKRTKVLLIINDNKEEEFNVIVENDRIRVEIPEYLKPFLKNESLIELIRSFPNKGTMTKEIIDKVIHLSNVTGTGIEERDDNEIEKPMTREEIIEAIKEKKNLRASNMHGADLIGVDMQDMNLNGADLSGANISHANFQRAYCYNVNFSNANLFRANFYNADLGKVNFKGANLEKVDFGSANLSNAKNLTSARNFSSATLTRVNLTGVDLSGVDLRGVNLFCANLHEANLSNSNLSNASLVDVILTEAILVDTITKGVIVNEGIDTSYIKIVHEEDIENEDKLKEALDKIEEELRNKIFRDNENNNWEKLYTSHMGPST